jgi:hypothetical protein
MAIIGTAEGTIMPTIITVHMTTTNANSIADHGVCARHHKPHARRNHPEAAHVDATRAHVGREPKQVAPRQSAQQDERQDDHDAVAPEYGGFCGQKFDKLAREIGFPKFLRDTGSYLMTLVSEHQGSLSRPQSSKETQVALETHSSAPD